MNDSTTQFSGASAGSYESASCRNIGLSERIISVTAGAFILYNGITGVFRRKPVKSLTEILAGGGLIYRGAVGYCPLKSTIDGRPNEITVIERRIMEPR